MAIHRPLFRDRRDAGRQLARAIGAFEKPPIVYGLARGGVPVAAEVAEALGARLDLVVVRKIGHPLHPEFALGALTRGHVVLQHGLDEVEDPGLRRHIDTIAERARVLDEELHAAIDPIDPRGAPCLLVDDGLATGATMTAACHWARSGGVTKLSVATPVAAKSSIESLSTVADEVVCPFVIEGFRAVSEWYADFSPVREDEVVDVVRAFRARHLEAGDGVGTTR